MYCSQIGLSKPRLRSRLAIASGVAREPNMMRTGSPGIRRSMKKTTIVMPIATDTSCSRRRPRNPSLSMTPVGYRPANLRGPPNLPHAVVGGGEDLEAVDIRANGGPTVWEVEIEDEGVVETELLDLVIHLLALVRILLRQRLLGQFIDARIDVASPECSGPVGARSHRVARDL